MLWYYGVMLMPLCVGIVLVLVLVGLLVAEVLVLVLVLEATVLETSLMVKRKTALQTAISSALA